MIKRNLFHPHEGRKSKCLPLEMKITLLCSSGLLMRPSIQHRKRSVDKSIHRANIFWEDSLFLIPNLLAQILFG